MSTRLMRSPMRLLAALLVVAGLALSVPASCWCSTGDHVGMLIHPLFPHRHGDAHASVPESEPDDALAYQAPLVLIGMPVSDLSGQSVAGGEIVLPALLGLVLLSAGRLRRRGSPSPNQHLVGPAPPPPRRVLAAS